MNERLAPSAVADPVVLERAGSAVGRVREWARRVANLALDPDAARTTRPLLVYQATLAENLGAQVFDNVEYVMAPLRDALRDAKASGELPDIDPERAADHVYHATWGWVHGRILAYRQPTEQDAEALVEFVLRGLR